MLLKFESVQVFEHFKNAIEQQYPLEETALDVYQQSKEAHEVSILCPTYKTAMM